MQLDLKSRNNYLIDAHKVIFWRERNVNAIYGIIYLLSFYSIRIDLVGVDGCFTMTLEGTPRIIVINNILRIPGKNFPLIDIFSSTIRRGNIMVRILQKLKMPKSTLKSA
jgi:hypothetical protein